MAKIVDVTQPGRAWIITGVHPGRIHSSPTPDDKGQPEPGKPGPGGPKPSDSDREGQATDPDPNQPDANPKPAKQSDGDKDVVGPYRRTGRPD